MPPAPSVRDNLYRDALMTIVLPLEPQKEARLIALARKKGVTADVLVSDAVDRILAEQPETPGEPTRSLRGILAKYGPAPSEADIDQNRAEMFANFPRTDF
jgi:hypothetical protein